MAVWKFQNVPYEQLETFKKLFQSIPLVAFILGWHFPDFYRKIFCFGDYNRGKRWKKKQDPDESWSGSNKEFTERLVYSTF